MVGHGLGKLVALGVVVMAFAISGCGGSSDGGSTAEAGSSGAGKPLSAAAYGKRAEAICRKTGARQAEEIKQLAAEHPPGSTDQEQLAELTVQTAKPIFLNMVEELEALELPTGEEGDQYREWVEAVDGAVDKMEASGTEGLNATVSAHHKAKRAGLEICSLL